VPSPPQESTTAIASISTMKSGPASRVTPTVVLVGIAALLEFVEVGNKRVGLDDVRPCRAGGLEAKVEVFERLFHLGAHITFTDTIAVDVAGQLAGGVDDLAGAADCHDVRIRRLPVGHPHIHPLRLKPFSLKGHSHSPGCVHLLARHGSCCRARGGGRVAAYGPVCHSGCGFDWAEALFSILISVTWP